MRFIGFVFFRYRETSVMTDIDMIEDYDLFLEEVIDM